MKNPRATNKRSALLDPPSMDGPQIDAKDSRSAREFKNLVENSPDIVARMGLDLRYIYVNGTITDAFGIAPEHCIGHTNDELGLPPVISAAYSSAIAQAIKSRAGQIFEFTFPRGDAVLHFTARAIPEFDENSVVESVLMITYDITERAQAQLERDALLVREKAARVDAEKASKAREQFLAIVSHELRSPLSGIQSWAHVLESRLDSDVPIVQRAIAGIKIGVEQQARLIDDLLDATQVISGKLRISAERSLLQPHVHAELSRATAVAEAKGVVVHTTIEEAPIYLFADGPRLEQIVENLLSNAIKFSAAGGQVWVTLAESSGQATLSVRDEGKGISGEFLPHVFEPFSQGDPSSTRKADGLGLGLTLARRLVELHGGSISASSSGEGQGATFTVSFPLDQKGADVPALSAAKPSPWPLGGVSLDGVRVMLIDDQKEARDSLAELLGEADAGVAVFASGMAAVDSYREAPANERPDIVVCDIAMPDCDGYATLGMIRAIELADRKQGRGKRAVTVALTAFSQAEDKFRALSSGFDAHVAKPVRPDDLVRLIKELVSRPAAK